MDNLLPRSQLVGVTVPFYPKADNGRRLYPLLLHSALRPRLWAPFLKASH